tara:strand:- start:912 stop:1514 length:603 start_codon:yes stop_codon:yes gene_type:complete
MDIAGARNRVRLITDREDVAYFTDAEIDGFLAMSVDEFVSQYYNSFESNQDSRDKLQKIVFSSVVSVSDSVPYSIAGLVNSETTPVANYSKMLSMVMSLSPFKRVKIIQLSDLSAYLDDPFNKADTNNPVAYLSGDNIYTKGLSSSTSIDVKYLSDTTLVTDLSSHTHEEVCQIAARKILATLGDVRYQAIQSEIAERRV